LAQLGLGSAGGAALEMARSPFAKSLASLKQLALSKVGVGVIAAAVAGGAGYATGRHQEQEIERGMPARSAPALVTASVVPSPTASVSSVARAVAPLADRSGAAIESPRSDSPPTATAARVFPPPAAQTVRPRSESVAITTSARAAPTIDAGSTVTQSATERVSESPASLIAEELEAIRVARTCVQKGDGKGALAALDAYAARNPHGTFEEEGIALRVRALRLLGDAAGAARERANLQTRFPASVHLPTLE
jgi:hypothetical protein